MEIKKILTLIILLFSQSVFCQQTKEATLSVENHVNISNDLRIELLDTFKKMISQGLYCYPEIPRRAFKKCSKRFFIPKSEILALCDTEIFGSGRIGLAVGTSGIYFKNDWTSAMPGRFFISFSDFKNIKVNKSIRDEIQIGDFYFNNTVGNCSSEFIVNLLTMIQKKVNEK